MLENNSAQSKELEEKQKSSFVQLMLSTAQDLPRALWILPEVQIISSESAKRALTWPSKAAYLGGPTVVLEALHNGWLSHGRQSVSPDSTDVWWLPKSTTAQLQRAVLWFERAEKFTKCFQKQVTIKWWEKVVLRFGSSLSLCFMDVTCLPANLSYVCVRVGFRGHEETNSMLPPLPSHLSLTHWCLPGALGPRLWLWLSVGETLLPSSAVCYRQGHTVWLQTHLPSSASPDFCPLNVPCIMSHCSSIECGPCPLDFTVCDGISTWKHFN